MTVAPATLSQMIASTRFEALRKAIVDRLKGLMTGIAIVPHPGKLDMNDVLAKAIVAAPGLAIGWTRIRSVRDLGGTYGLPVDWIAYVVAEDFADTRAVPQKRVDRAIVAAAIGTHLLRILADPDAASWGLTGISVPLADPEPEMRPVFTVTTAERASALYVVTWTQALLFEGEPLFEGPRPEIHALPDGMTFDLPEGDIPAELLAVLAGGDSAEGGEP